MTAFQSLGKVRDAAGRSEAALNGKRQRAGFGRTVFFAIALAVPASALAAPEAPPKPAVPGIRVGQVPSEIRTVATTADGLPSNDVLSVTVLSSGEIYAGTAAGLARFDGHKWSAVSAVKGPVKLVTRTRDGVLATSGDSIFRVRKGESDSLTALPEAARKPDDLRSLAGGRTILLLGTRAGLFQSTRSPFTPVDALNSLLGPDKDIRQVAVSADGHVAVAAAAGLFLRSPEGTWERLNPVNGSRSWFPRDVRGVAFDGRGLLWFASPEGVGRFDGDKWSLYTGEEGLPYNDFTTVAAGEDGVVWFGTKIGAIRFDLDNSTWNYRQGRRWLPDDKVRAITVSENGDAWFATDHGLGRIERRMMTLAEKAAYFEEEIDKYHRRTPYQYVLEVAVEKPGDTGKIIQHDSDNDGLWTSMYGAGECFAYAATHDPQAKKRATAALQAMRFLSTVTQGGEHPAPKGFPARSILPTSGHNPNEHDSVAHDEEAHARDPLWKVLSPRWPKSADGKWYWKTDTSSDELDGHYFLYACYNDLVAETDAEKHLVREIVADVTGHLIDHELDLVDHDGKPTRWARFGPQTLNQVTWGSGRGLNSLSILSYLLVAEHVTGDKRFRDVFDHLVKDHGYLANIIFPKSHTGPGTGNQSDDEMAFMCYYDLLKYAKDPEVRRAANMSLAGYWALEEPEQSPLFNYIYVASYSTPRRQGRGGSNQSSATRRRPQGRIPDQRVAAIADGLDFLKRYPLDRFEWGFKNSHRLDIVRLTRFPGRFYRNARGHLRSGKVLPIDERFIEHWNYDAWSIDSDANGKSLADGASFLLPYYMGLYHGFIIEEKPSTSPSGPNLSRR